jgi:hypothetical protein
MDCESSATLSFSEFLFPTPKKISKIFFKTGTNFLKKSKIGRPPPQTSPLQNVHLAIHHSCSSIGNTTNC